MLIERSLRHVSRLLLPQYLVLLVWCALSQAATAQTPALDPTSAGRSYVIAFPDTTANLTDPRYVNTLQDIVAVYLYSPVETMVTITGSTFSTSLRLAARKFEEVQVKNPSTFTDSVFVTKLGAVSNNTFRVESEHPVVVYCYVFTKFGGEMWTPIPVERWGKEYYVAATPGEIIGDETLSSKSALIRKNKMAPAQATIVAAYNRTAVHIYPTGALLGNPALTVTLDAGQTYQVQSVVDTISSHIGQAQPDIGGTLITADRPVGVISGNTRAQVVQDVSIYIGNALKNMTAEWLAPAEQFGTEFVYTPTWDTRHILGTRNEKLSEKRGVEIVRVYGASQAAGQVYFRYDSTRVDTTTVASTEVREYRVPAIAGRYVRTQKPAQAMMHSTSVARLVSALNSTIRTNYETWGPYQIELLPREQWTSFAPYHAPTYPYETKHYMNVIADTSALDKVFDELGMPFDFNQGIIKGTGMMWGTMQVAAGSTHYLEGREGARFYAYMYGLRPGLEYWAGREFQEIVGVSYGYPIAPGRRVLRGGDTLQIDTIRTACDFHVKVRAVNSNPLGLRSADLEGAVNARLSTVTPLVADGLVGFTSAEFSIVPLDPARDAGGTLVLTDRSGKTWRVPYSYTGEVGTFNAGSTFDLGNVTVGTTKDTVIIISNTTTRDICVKNLRLNGGQGMTIVSTEPEGPAFTPATAVTLAPGAALRVTVRGLPLVKERVYRDTLQVGLCCTTTRLPLRLGTTYPCIVVNDLEFGPLTLNQQQTLALRICNDGGGVVMLDNPSGDSVITWLAERFTIAPADLTALKNANLGSGECVEVPVTFSSPVPGVFRETARVWADTRDCRDTSLWSAVVRIPQSGVEKSEGGDGFIFAGVQPNPAHGTTAIDFILPRAVHTMVTLYNSLGERAAVPFEGGLDAGAHRVLWHADEHPPGVYFCRITAGTWSETGTVVVK